MSHEKICNYLVSQSRVWQNRMFSWNFVLCVCVCVCVCVYTHTSILGHCAWGWNGTGRADCILQKKETPFCTLSELWIMCLVALGITYLWPNWPPGLTNTRVHTKILCCQKECNNPLHSQSPLSSWWYPLVQATMYNQLTLLIMIMAVTSLYLP